MRWSRAGVLTTLGTVTAVLAATVSASAAGAEPVGLGRAGDVRIAPVQAVAADDVVDSYGVGIHLNFLDTPYRDADAVASAIADLGVRHVRDDLYLDAPRQYRAINTVADAGVRFDLIMGRPTSGARPADYVDTVATELPVGVVESIEGVNEWDISGRDDWVAEMKSWQQGLHDAARAEPATADLPLLSPSLAFRWNYDDAGDLSQHADLANAHMYPGGFRPSTEVDNITRAVRGSIPDKPLVVTEAGYHNATSFDHGHRAVPEEVSGVYLPRLLLEHVLRGHQRVYSYELIDSFDDPDLTDPEAHFGLLRHDLTPKPAYTAMKNLLAMLSDPGPSFAPGALAVTADSLPADARYLLTEKRDGRFVLLLWRDVPVYDPVERTPLPVTPADVTLRFGARHDLTVYRPSTSGDPVSSTTSHSLPLRLDGEVTVVMIDPEQPVRPADPTGVTATAGDRRAIVSWDQPAGSAEVTGFAVSRVPGGKERIVGADARSFRDTGLVNGRRYTYSVRALTDAGASAAVAAPPVVPATVPEAPGIVSLRAGRQRVTLTWREPRDRGRPIIGYRLLCRGTALKVAPEEHEVGPGEYRATISGLPTGRRLRVGVQALNEVGWSRVARSGAVTTR